MRNSVLGASERPRRCSHLHTMKMRPKKTPAMFQNNGQSCATFSFLANEVFAMLPRKESNRPSRWAGGSLLSRGLT